MRLIRAILAGAVVVALAGGAIVWRGRSVPSPRSAAGPADSGLDSTITVEWNNVPFQDAVDDLSHRTGIPITVDWAAINRHKIQQVQTVWLYLNSVRAGLVLDIMLERMNSQWEFFPEDFICYRYDPVGRMITCNPSVRNTMPRAYDVRSILDQLERWIDLPVGDGPPFGRAKDPNVLARQIARGTLDGFVQRVLANGGQIIGEAKRTDTLDGLVQRVVASRSYLGPHLTSWVDRRMLIVATAPEHRRIMEMLRVLGEVCEGRLPAARPPRTLTAPESKQYSWPGDTAVQPSLHAALSTVTTVTGLNVVFIPDGLDGQWCAVPRWLPNPALGPKDVDRPWVASLSDYMEYILQGHFLEWEVRENVLLLRMPFAAGKTHLAHDIRQIADRYANANEELRKAIDDAASNLPAGYTSFGPYLVVYGSPRQHRESARILEAMLTWSPPAQAGR